MDGDCPFLALWLHHRRELQFQSGRHEEAREVITSALGRGLIED
jgi:hypothetical protein